MFLPCSECNCIRTGTTEGGQASSGSLRVSILRFCRSQPCLHPTTEIPLLILSHIHRQVSVWRPINNISPSYQHTGYTLTIFRSPSFSDCCLDQGFIFSYPGNVIMTDIQLAGWLTQQTQYRQWEVEGGLQYWHWHSHRYSGYINLSASHNIDGDQLLQKLNASLTKMRGPLITCPRKTSLEMRLTFNDCSSLLTFSPLTWPLDWSLSALCKAEESW